MVIAGLVRAQGVGRGDGDCMGIVLVGTHRSSVEGNWCRVVRVLVVSLQCV